MLWCKPCSKMLRLHLHRLGSETPQILHQFKNQLRLFFSSLICPFSFPSLPQTSISPLLPPFPLPHEFSYSHYLESDGGLILGGLQEFCLALPLSILTTPHSHSPFVFNWVESLGCGLQTSVFVQASLFEAWKDTGEGGLSTEEGRHG